MQTNGDIPCSWIRRTNIVKMSVLLETIHTFSTISIKIPTAFITRARMNNPKICLEPQKTSNNHSHLGKKNTTEVSQFQISSYIAKQ